MRESPFFIFVNSANREYNKNTLKWDIMEYSIIRRNVVFSWSISRGLNRHPLYLTPPQNHLS